MVMTTKLKWHAIKRLKILILLPLFFITEISAGGSAKTSSNCSEVTTEHESLFSSLISISYPDILLISMLITICFVKIMEILFEFITSLTHDSPFSSMIAMIKNELMIVGFSALFLKVIVHSSHFLNHDWYFSLEFSDVLIPAFVFCSCVIGLGLVALAATQCGIWARACKRNLDELLDEFLDIKCIRLAMFFAPFQLVIDQMEFRIFKVIFCELYRISSALPFDDYVTLVFEKYILSLIEKQPLDWFILFVMLLLTLSLKNWFNGLPSYGKSCLIGGELNDECLAEKAMELFAILGALIFVGVCMLAAITRYYVVAALRASDVEVSALGYIDFLRNRAIRESSTKALTTEDLRTSLESGQSSAPKSLFERMSEFLSFSIERDRSKSYESTDENLNASEKGTSSAAGEISPVLEKLKMPPGGPDITSMPPSSIQTRRSYGQPSGNNTKSKSKQQSWSFFSLFKKSNVGRIVPYREGTALPSRPSPPPSSSTPKSLSPPPPPLPQQISQHATFRTFRKSRKSVIFNIRNISTDMAIVAARKRLISYIFLFSSPALYFQFVKSFLVATAVFLAFWCVNFASLSQREWKVITFLPGAICAVLFLFVVKNAALLKAIVAIDKEALLGVIEQAEDARQLHGEIRAKLMKNLKSESGDPKAELKNFFALIDVDGSSKLSRAEFKECMASLGMTFSQKKWDKIFHEIDLNFDNEISLHEFIIFIFPDDSEAMNEEKRRLDGIKERVIRRQTIMMSGKSSAALFPITSLTSLPLDGGKEDVGDDEDGDDDEDEDDDDEDEDEDEDDGHGERVHIEISKDDGLV